MKQVGNGLKVSHLLVKQSNNHRMLHQSLVIQNDYKQKVKFDWPNENHTM